MQQSDTAWLECWVREQKWGGGGGYGGGFLSNPLIANTALMFIINQK